MLVHIKVGNKSHTPTNEDLQKIVTRFHTDRVFVNDYSVKVLMADTSYLAMNAEEVKYTVVITAGSPKWNPTQNELDELQALFEAALKDPKGSTVATRHDVSVEIIVHTNSILGTPTSPYKIRFK